MNLTHRARMCLGWIVKVTARHGVSTMGNHRPCDIRELLRQGAIIRAGRVTIEGKRRQTYWPTQAGHQYWQPREEQ